jgi:hypothetical protein
MWITFDVLVLANQWIGFLAIPLLLLVFIARFPYLGRW